MLKKKIVSIFCLLVIVFNLTACANNPLPEDDNGVEAVFEQDYSTLESIATYLLSLEESTVYIELDPLRIMGEYGEPMELTDLQTEQLVNELAEKGYYDIDKVSGAVVFEVWRKSFDEEFEAGFVYSDDGTVDSSAVMFLTYQQPLSKENWYYYEADYNEWRAKRTGY